MSSQQEWVRDLMHYMVKNMDRYNGDMLNVAYKYTINAAVDNYSLVYRVSDSVPEKNVNLFHNRYTANFKKGFYRHVILSEKAYKMLKNASDNEVRDDLRSKLHGEHLTPNSFIIKELNELVGKDLDSLRERIEYIFSNAKICIITQDEQLILDGTDDSGHLKKYNAIEITEFWIAYEKILASHSDCISVRLNKEDFDKLVGCYKKDSGYGSIRAWLLMREQVKFVDSFGNPFEFSGVLRYLSDNNYTI